MIMKELDFDAQCEPVSLMEHFFRASKNTLNNANDEISLGNELNIDEPHNHCSEVFPMSHSLSTSNSEADDLERTSPFLADDLERTSPFLAEESIILLFRDVSMTANTIFNSEDLHSVSLEAPSQIQSNELST